VDLDFRSVEREFEDAAGRLGPLSVCLPSGSAAALVGPSGSGKSTLLHMVAGIVAPHRGEVVVGGRNLWQLPERDRTRFRLESIGLVFQFAELVPELTVAENVGLPLWLLRRRQIDASVLPVMEELGIAHLRRKLPSQVSGGERQRAAIARALVHGPAIVLADEPTGSLDSRRGAEAMAIMLGACLSRGCTLLVATHDPLVAAGLGTIVDLASDELCR
jgi:putative ABC transport system ATP-binding protein